MFWKIIATGFGSGYSPIAPGTAGALAALIMAIYISNCFCQIGCFKTGNPWEILFFLSIIFFVLGKIACDRLESVWGHDPSKIVVDEMVGMWVSLLFVPFAMKNLLMAFVLFRIFDIWKPLGIRQMEKLKGGWGVMMDDVLAGVYALVVMQAVLFFID